MPKRFILDVLVLLGITGALCFACVVAWELHPALGTFAALVSASVVRSL